MKKATLLMLGFDQRQASVYYRLDGTTKLLKGAIAALKKVRTRKGYQPLVSELLLYLGRLNCWIDLEIPWSRLAKAFRAK